MRLAKSLEKLRSQVNAEYPHRNKASDGWLGDEKHQMVASDHNPNLQEVVTALDLTHDPKSGFDAHALANNLIINRHPNLKYVISKQRIAGDWTGWKWHKYNGSNPHDKHIHISVGNGPDGQSKQPYDNVTKWNIGGKMDDTKAAGHVMADRIYKAVLFRGLPKAEYDKFHKTKTAKRIFDEARLSPEHKALEKKLSTPSDVDPLYRRVTEAVKKAFGK